MYTLADLFEYMWQVERDPKQKTREEMAQEIEDFIEETKSIEGY